MSEPLAEAASPRHAELAADVPAERVDQFVARSRLLPSRAVATRLIRVGAILVNGDTVKPSHELAVGDRVSLDLPDPEPAAPSAEAIELDVVYEDSDLLVIDKPAGMVVHPGSGNLTGTMVNALLAMHAEWPSLGGPSRPGIVHRLDRGTSGLIIVARSDLALRRLAADLAARRVSRVYLAIARGILREGGIVDAPIGRHPQDRKRMAVVENGRTATTTFMPLEQLDDATLLEVTLGSGRTHQVRVHLAAIGHALIGDTTYGAAQVSSVIGRPALHAHRLRFRHPTTGADLAFESPPPADFEGALAALRRARR